MDFCVLVNSTCKKKTLKQTIHFFCIITVSRRIKGSMIRWGWVMQGRGKRCSPQVFFKDKWGGAGQGEGRGRARGGTGQGKGRGRE